MVVTVVRNDDKFLESLITSIANQRIRPNMWVIVDDSSIDGTSKVGEQASKNHDWIEFIQYNGHDLNDLERSERIARLFSIGINSINLNWDYCSKIDADMTLDKEYFSSIYEEFENNPNLGIASGNCFTMSRGRKTIEKVAKGHTRGGLKTYRRQCFDEISGIPLARGWDSIDNIRAEMMGWETENFPNLLTLHMRPTGERKGLVKTSFDEGRKSYFLGYSVPYIIARSVHKLSNKPLLISGLAMLFGFIYGAISRSNRFEGKEEIKFLRKRQLSKLTFGLLPSGKK